MQQLIDKYSEELLYIENSFELTERTQRESNSTQRNALLPTVEFKKQVDDTEVLDRLYRARKSRKRSTTLAWSKNRFSKKKRQWHVIKQKLELLAKERLNDLSTLQCNMRRTELYLFQCIKTFVSSEFNWKKQGRETIVLDDGRRRTIHPIIKRKIEEIRKLQTAIDLYEECAREQGVGLHRKYPAIEKVQPRDYRDFFHEHRE